MKPLEHTIAIKGSTILNVDDYAPGRYTRSKVLRHAGFQVLEAGSGEHALQQLRHRPDLVLLDINLPDINGMEVCKRIKENPDTAGVVVLHLTASNCLPEEQAAGLEGGADGYLTEPIEPAVLIATVKSLLRVRRAEDALRRSNTALRSLTDILSHELREPVRHALTFTELLHTSLEGRISAEQEEYFSRVFAGAARMNELIEAVLIYSRAIYDPPTPTTVNAQEALDATLIELELRIAESGAQVICPKKLPLVIADKVVMIRLFSNLLSNSLKYRSEEPPVIRVTAESKGDFIEFCFEDNGIGIDPKFHARIFDVFRRLHGAEYPGTGVGLSLCRRIVESLGGTIWVESKAGEGARFYFTLPRAERQEHLSASQK